MKMLKTKARNAGTGLETVAEEKLEDIQFNVHKFNNRPKPDDPERITCFPRTTRVPLIATSRIPRADSAQRVCDIRGSSEDHR